MRFCSNLVLFVRNLDAQPQAPPDGMTEGVDGEWEEEDVIEDGEGGAGQGQEDVDPEEEAMARMMGFGGFGSSKVRTSSLG